MSGNAEKKDEQLLYEDFHGRFGTFEEVFERNQKELMDSRRKHHDPNCREPNCAYINAPAATTAELDLAPIEARWVKKFPTSQGYYWMWKPKMSFHAYREPPEVIWVTGHNLESETADGWYEYLNDEFRYKSEAKGLTMNGVEFLGPIEPDSNAALIAEIKRLRAEVERLKGQK